MSRVEHRSKRHDWQTPGGVLERVRRVGRIALDPCTSEGNPTGADYAIVAEGGLEANWVARSGPGGIVYCNPPCGRALPAWVRKACLQAELGVEIVMLTPARPDTGWFELLWSRASAVCFWRGRITFVGAPAPAPFPSALWAFGADIRRPFVAALCDAGIVEVLR